MCLHDCRRPETQGEHVGSSPSKFWYIVFYPSDLDILLADNMIVASSSSCLCASMIADGLKHRENMLVAHPVSSGTLYCILPK